MHISYLPNDVLGEIAMLSRAVAIGNLWCCGCRLLNSKLMSPDSMQVCDLQSGPMPVGRVPKFVYRLRGLKRIYLDLNAVNSAQILPSDFCSRAFATTEVEMISVNSKELLDGWFVSRGKNCIDVSKFERLRVLKFTAAASIDPNLGQNLESFLLALPSTLTSLSIIILNTYSVKVQLREMVLPVNIQELTLGLEFKNLDFIFSLPLLRKLSLPYVSDALFSVKAGKPLPDLEILELPSMSSLKKSRTETSNRQQQSLFEFMSLLPNLDQLVSNSNAFKWKSNPIWSKIRHFHILMNRTSFLPIYKFPASTISIEAHGVLSDQSGSFAHFHNLTSLDLHTEIRLKNFELPDSITSLACGWNDKFENELTFLPTHLIRLTRRVSQSLGSIPIDVLPGTLSAIIAPADLGLNAKKEIKNWNGSSWITIDLALRTDDVYSFETIWSYFKPTSQHLIMNLAFKAATRKCQNILETILSKDTFWTAVRSKPTMNPSDLLRWVPTVTLTQLYRQGLRFNYFPVSRVNETCKLDSVEFLELLFSDSTMRTQENKRFSFTSAIFSKSHKCARWLIDHELYECDLQEITRMSVVKRDIDFLNMLLDLDLNQKEDPSERFLQLLKEYYLPKILPIDVSMLPSLDIWYSLRFLDWASSYGVVDSVVNDETVRLVLNCYRGLPQELSHSTEPIFFEIFSWLETHHDSFTSYITDISHIAKELGHSNHETTQQTKSLTYLCVLV